MNYYCCHSRGYVHLAASNSPNYHNFTRLSATYQAFDLSLELLLSCGNGLLGAEDRDELLVLVLLRGEDDPGAGLVPDRLHVGPVPSDEELVVLRLRPDLSREGGELLLVGQAEQHFLGLGHVVLGAANGHLKEVIKLNEVC